MMNQQMRSMQVLEHQTLLPEASTLLSGKPMGYGMDSKKKTLLDVCEYLIDHQVDNGLFDQLVLNNFISPDDITPTLLKKKYTKEALLIISNIDQTLPQVDMLIKVSHFVIQLYENDDKNETLKPLPSLIGLTGMISLFHQFS